MTTKYLLNPFNALYQDDILLSNKPEIQELNKYVLSLENKIQGDFDLEYLTFEFACNQFGFVRNGLLLAKIKFFKLYKNYGDRTFASFCQEQLKKQRWQINDTIKAARVVLELMYAGFEVLPTNISQAVTLAQLSGEELIAKWRSVIDLLPSDKITAKSIRSLLFPPIENKAIATIQLPAKIHEDIHTEAAKRGLSIVNLIQVMLKFFITGGTTSSYSGVNSHLLQYKINTKDYANEERIWRSDLTESIRDNQTKHTRC